MCKGFGLYVLLVCCLEVRVMLVQMFSDPIPLDYFRFRRFNVEIIDDGNDHTTCCVDWNRHRGHTGR